MKCRVGQVSPSYLATLFLMGLGSVAHLWISAVLLLGRQPGLLPYEIMAALAWFWGGWYFFLNRRKVGLILTAFCFLLSLGLGLMALGEALDVPGAYLPPL